MSVVEMVAWVTAALFAAVAVFQVALAAGAPLGDMAWSGTHPGTLPGRLRAASAVSALLLLVMGGIVLARAGVIGDGGTAVTVASWAVVVFVALSAAGNLASRSPRERAVFGPVGVLLLAGALTVAILGPA